MVTKQESCKAMSISGLCYTRDTKGTRVLRSSSSGYSSDLFIVGIYSYRKAYICFTSWFLYLIRCKTSGEFDMCETAHSALGSTTFVSLLRDNNGSRSRSTLWRVRCTMKVSILLMKTYRRRLSSFS